MTRALVALALSLTATAAAAEPPLGTRIGDRLRTDGKEDEATAARRGHAFASCMVNKHSAQAKKLLSQTTEQGYTAAYNKLTSGDIECFSTAFDDANHVTEGWKITIPPAVMRGLLAEELIKHDAVRYSSLPALPRQLSYSRPWYPGTTRYEAVDEMATCASDVAPAEVLALLNTAPYTDAERTAVGALAPTLGACLRAGFQLGANRQALRAALAEALYQRVAMPPPAATPGSTQVAHTQERGN
jgi:hypothetical protein